MEPPDPETVALTLTPESEMEPAEITESAPPPDAPAADSVRLEEIEPEPKLVKRMLPPPPLEPSSVKDATLVMEMLPDAVVATNKPPFVEPEAFITPSG